MRLGLRRATCLGRRIFYINEYEGKREKKEEGKKERKREIEKLKEREKKEL